MSESRGAKGKKLSDAELMEIVRSQFVCLGFDSTDDPWARHFICVKRDEDDEDCIKSRFSAKFRGPVTDVLTAAWLAQNEHWNTKSHDEVWAADFLAARGYASEGFLSERPAQVLLLKSPHEQERSRPNWRGPMSRKPEPIRFPQKFELTAFAESVAALEGAARNLRDAKLSAGDFATPGAFALYQNLQRYIAECLEPFEASRAIRDREDS